MEAARCEGAAMSEDSRQVSRPKIALFLHSLGGGGAERVTLTLAGCFAERDIDVDLVLGLFEGELVPQVPEAVRVVELSASRAMACIPGLRRYLRRERPTALLSAMEHLNIPAIWAHRLARVETRMVVAVHSTVSILTRHAKERRAALLPFLAGRFYGWADAIVAVSQGAADDLSETTGLPRSSIHVIYNPVVTPGLLDRARAEANHPWFGDAAPLVVLAVGSLTTPKDYPTLLRAFRRVRDDRPAKLLVLGEGEKRAELEALRGELGLTEDVAFPGYVANPYAYMSRAGVFVLSSAFEALPTVLIEAMACGAPVVSTDCRSGPSEILEGGTHGRLVPVSDDAALAAAIIETVASPPSAERMRAAAERFRPDPIVDTYLDILLGATPRPGVKAAN
jgi:glycosyltransferase involved in cell wall biosynthesis